MVKESYSQVELGPTLDRLPWIYVIHVRNLQQFAVVIALAGARVPAGTSSRLFYLHAVGSWLECSVVQQALEATMRELEYVAAAARLTQDCLDRVKLQCCDEVTRCCLRIEGINARVAADPVVAGEVRQRSASAVPGCTRQEIPPLQMSQLMAVVDAACEAQDSAVIAVSGVRREQNARRRAAYREKQKSRRTSVVSESGMLHLESAASPVSIVVVEPTLVLEATLEPAPAPAMAVGTAEAPTMEFLDLADRYGEFGS